MQFSKHTNIISVHKGSQWSVYRDDFGYVTQQLGWNNLNLPLLSEIRFQPFLIVNGYCTRNYNSLLRLELGLFKCQRAEFPYSDIGFVSKKFTRMNNFLHFLVNDSTIKLKIILL